VGAAGAEHALVKRWRAKLCVAYMLLVSMTNAQQPGYDASSSDSMTSAALRASLLGNEERAREIAQARLKWEQPRNVKPEFVISERLAILAESSRRWLPSDRIAKQQLGAYPRTDASLAFRESLRSVEPREVLRNATATRVYESRRRAFNSVVGALAGVLRLQFFGLIQLPLDVAEGAVSGRPFVNPEQRRELLAARGVLEDRPSHAAAKGLVARYEPRRLRLALEHAEANAERAAKQQRWETARWWMQWARTLDPDWRAPSDLVRVGETMEREEDERLQSLFVRQVVVDDREEAWLRWVLASLDTPAEAEGRTPLRELGREELGVDVRASILAVRRNPATPQVTARALDVIAGLDHPAWSPRAAGYREVGLYDAQDRLNAARADLRRARRDFVLWGTDPTIGSRTITPEDARLAESNLITGARSLFVFDMLGRSLALPLLPPGTFGREGILEATGSAERELRISEAGRDLLRAEAVALQKSRRPGQAARIWEQLDEPDRMESARARAARRLERLAREAPTAREEARVLQRVVAGWPKTPAAQRAAKRLAIVEEQMAMLTEITRDEWRALAPTWSEMGWEAPVAEAPAQARLMEAGTVEWRIRKKDPWQLAEIEPDTFDRMVASLREVRLGGRVAKVLDEPRERKRVPLLLDASALPGFDVTPGLVPADVPSEERRMYK
jgi:hypothetical protein